MMQLLGVDTGGTFTDFVMLDGDGKLFTHKVLSTPHSPELAILQGIQELNIDLDTARIVHGSTVATNAVLERKGVRVAYITNKGLGDVLRIGRQARRELYNLQPQPISAPVEDDFIFEIDVRVGADGQVVKELEAQALEQLLSDVTALNPDAVAINLLFSFLDDRHEKAIARALQSCGFVCCSSDVLPEYKEYERGIATWLNAYVGPLMEGYLNRLQQGTAPAKLSVMQSSGGTIDAQHAARNSVHLLLSGPAGGLQAARFIGQLSESPRLLTFDMGGTSTDVALIDNGIRLTSEGRIADFPVSVPMVDMHTIGAGGGSIAWLDEGGMLQVGPQSAGAAPGPACYGKGGTRATVTDANLVLGRLQAGAFLGGGMQLDVEAARQAVKALALKLDSDIETVAEGIVRIANEHMAQALRVISVQRGEDPADYVLTSFGGAGGLHVCELAEILGLHRALVPVNGGVLSAMGMLVAPHSQEFSRTVTRVIEASEFDEFEQYFVELEDRGRNALEREGFESGEISLMRSADIRYLGQSYTLAVSWQSMSELLDSFAATHQRRFGHTLDEAVEIVNLRLRASGPDPRISLPQLSDNDEVPQPFSGSVYGFDEEVAIYQREHLYAGFSLEGPAIIAEKVSTTWLRPGWRCEVDRVGNLQLKRL